MGEQTIEGVGNMKLEDIKMIPLSEVLPDVIGVSMPAGEYISKRQAADILNLKPSSVQYHIGKGNLRAYKVDSQWNLNIEDVKKFKPNNMGKPSIYEKVR